MEEEFDPYGLPPDVTVQPQALIGMLGLDIPHKATHKAVWEAFALNRRTDRTPLHFQPLSPDFQMPPMKQKRQSYEWYIPKGILKSNWIPKYLCQVPALVVLFYDLDWNDANWTDKKNEVANKVQLLKTVFGGRNNRVALVLIQSGISVPGEDTGAAEKAATLCTACDLPAKHLFVLPHSDVHLLGYTVRLENALSEIAWSFYQGEAKGVRAHRDFLNKTNHTLLFVRHQFKLGFLNEMRNDAQAAIKHYAQCYHHLLELRSTDTNLHEIRIVAAIVNYKICKLDFALNLPRDAIAQFRRHIDLFRQRTGPKELIFEHYAWLSKQYQLFGDVFEEAVRTGLPAVQTQHPGFYYQQAAQYAVLRRKTALQVCKGEGVRAPDLLEGWSKLEFYGQRPWRPGKHSLEPPEQQREMEGVKEVQYHEIQEVNHSNVIIPLFSSAISQFKKYRCPRIKRHLMVQMADQYHQANDSSKALTLLNHLMWDYRSEKWWTLLQSASVLGLQCAFDTAAITEYFGLALEYMAKKLSSTQQEKNRVHNNLVKLLNGVAPDPEPGTSGEALTAATEAWSTLLSKQVTPITVDMTALVPCVEVRASFLKQQYHVDQQVTIVVKIRNTSGCPLSVSSLSVGVSSLAHCERLVEASPQEVVLPSHQVMQVQLHFVPRVEDIAKKIKVVDVRGQLGSPGSTVVVWLHWSGSGNEGVALHAANAPAFPEFGVLCREEFDTASLITEAEILPRQPLLTVKVQHDTTALVWEWLPVQLHLTNTEAATISNITISLGLQKPSHSNLEHSTQVCTASDLHSDKLGCHVSEYKCGSLDVAQQTTVVFYIKSLTASERTYALKVCYSVCVPSGGGAVLCPCTHKQTLHTQSRIPFQVSVETQSIKFEKLARVASGESFLVVPRIKCTSHVPITLTNSCLALASEAHQIGTESISQVVNTELCEGEMGVDCFCVGVDDKIAANSAVTLGQYILYWKRSLGDSVPVSVSLGLPSVVMEHWGVWVQCEVNPQGTVRTPLPLAYNIFNHGTHTAELALSMQVSDAFMFAGHKEVRLRVLPGCSEQVTYTLYPLLAGNVHLPKLSLSLETHSPGQPTSLDPLLARILPTHIYIMPQPKENDQRTSSLASNLSTLVI